MTRNLRLSTCVFWPHENAGVRGVALAGNWLCEVVGWREQARPPPPPHSHHFVVSSNTRDTKAAIADANGIAKVSRSHNPAAFL